MRELIVPAKPKRILSLVAEVVPFLSTISLIFSTTLSVISCELLATGVSSRAKMWEEERVRSKELRRRHLINLLIIVF